MDLTNEEKEFLVEKYQRKYNVRRREALRRIFKNFNHFKVVNKLFKEKKS